MALASYPMPRLLDRRRPRRLVRPARAKRASPVPQARVCRRRRRLVGVMLSSDHLILCMVIVVRPCATLRASLYYPHAEFPPHPQLRWHRVPRLADTTRSANRAGDARIRARRGHAGLADSRRCPPTHRYRRPRHRAGGKHAHRCTHPLARREPCWNGASDEFVTRSSNVRLADDRPWNNAEMFDFERVEGSGSTDRAGGYKSVQQAQSV